MKFFEFIQQALSEGDGRPSSIRLNNFYLVVLIGFAVTFGFIWVVVCYENLIIAYLAVVAGLLTGLTGLKTYQKNIELESKDKPKDQATEIKLAEIKEGTTK